MKKLFVIEAAILFLLIAISPMVHSFNYAQPINCEPTSLEIDEMLTHESELITVLFSINTVRKRINELLEEYEEELVHIRTYLNDNGCDDGGITLPLPEPYQTTLDTILNEINQIADYFYNIYQNSSQPAGQQYSQQFGEQPKAGGGINKIVGPKIIIEFCFIGFGYDVWLNDATTKSLNYGNILVILAAAFGPKGIIVAAMIAGYIIYITNHNEGNGVFFTVAWAFYGGAAPVILNIRPQ